MAARLLCRRYGYRRCLVLALRAIRQSNCSARPRSAKVGAEIKISSSCATSVGAPTVVLSLMNATQSSHWSTSWGASTCRAWMMRSSALAWEKNTVSRG